MRDVGRIYIVCSLVFCMNKKWVIGAVSIVGFVLFVFVVLSLVRCGPFVKCESLDGLILCDYTPEERCETLSWSEKDCCLSSLEDAREKGWKILPADCCIDEESGNEMCADFDCYSVFGEPEIGTKWDVVKPKCEGGLAFCVPGSWNVAES